MEWVSVSDKLPEPNDIYLVLLGNINYQICFFNGTIWEHHYIDKVTHWMPLPELPNGMD